MSIRGSVNLPVAEIGIAGNSDYYLDHLSSAARHMFRCRRLCDVIVYGDARENGLTEEFAKLLCTTSQQQPRSVGYLDGGFQAFRYYFPFLVTSGVERNSAAFLRMGSYPSFVLPYLFLGAERDASPTTLSNLKIRYLVNCAVEIPTQTFPDVEVLRLDLVDADDCVITDAVHRARRFIDTHRGQGNVMVHCKAGISRSVAVVVGYLLLEFGDRVDYDTAFAYVRERRPQAFPNDGFVQQLRELEATLRGDGEPRSPPGPVVARSSDDRLTTSALSQLFGLKVDGIV